MNKYGDNTKLLKFNNFNSSYTKLCSKFANKNFKQTFLSSKQNILNKTSKF